MTYFILSAPTFTLIFIKLVSIYLELHLVRGFFINKRNEFNQKAFCNKHSTTKQNRYNFRI